jgi:ferredoxin
MSNQNSYRRIVRVPDACVDCGACVGQCKTGALTVDPTTYRVLFDLERCSACGLCVEACPFSALFAVDARLAADARREERHVAYSHL